MDNVKPHTITPHYVLPLKYPHLYHKVQGTKPTDKDKTATAHPEQEQQAHQEIRREATEEEQEGKQDTTPYFHSSPPSSTSETQTSSPSTESTNPTTPPQSRSPSPTPRTRETVYSGLGLAPSSLGCTSIYDKSKCPESTTDYVEMCVPTPSQLRNRNVRKRWGRYRWYD